MEWSAVALDFGPVLLAFAAVGVALLQNKTDDRGVELKMQGLYVEMSKDDREERKRLQRAVDGMSAKLAEYRVQRVQDEGERNQLKLTLQKEREVHDAQIARYEARISAYEKNAEIMTEQIEKMKTENGALREQVAGLVKQVDALQKRVNEVAARAASNANELEKEREYRLKVEAERDALRDERDKLAARVAELEAALATKAVEAAELKARVEVLEKQIIALGVTRDDS